MSILIIYKSYHRMNTEKVARAMADAIGATLVKVEAVQPEDIATYDLVGFGSGIYGGRPHKTLFTLVERLPPMEKDVFIFSTSGGPQAAHHRLLRERLAQKGYRIVSEFQCPGEFKPLGFIMNLNKGHPDEKDLQDARDFAKSLIAD